MPDLTCQVVQDGETVKMIPSEGDTSLTLVQMANRSVVKFVAAVDASGTLFLVQSQTHAPRLVSAQECKFNVVATVKVPTNLEDDMKLIVNFPIDKSHHQVTLTKRGACGLIGKVAYLSNEGIKFRNPSAGQHELPGTISYSAADEQAIRSLLVYQDGSTPRLAIEFVDGGSMSFDSSIMLRLADELVHSVGAVAVCLSKRYGADVTPIMTAQVDALLEKAATLPTWLLSGVKAALTTLLEKVQIKQTPPTNPKTAAPPSKDQAKLRLLSELASLEARVGQFRTNPLESKTFDALLAEFERLTKSVTPEPVQEEPFTFEPYKIVKGWEETVPKINAFLA
jgi:hypothetical protein